MAKKKILSTVSGERSITGERATRLHHLLQILTGGPQSRPALLKRLKLDVRGFYRDLELLRESGIEVRVNARRYHLDQGILVALARLPFPDPRLTLGEAIQLAKGKAKAHTKLRDQIDHILNPSEKKGR